MFSAFNSPKPTVDKATSAPTTLLNFCGNDSENVTIFLRDVKRAAHAQGRQDDDKWLTEYVELCLAGSALRWFSELDDEVAKSWKPLRRAFLQRFKPPLVPNPAAPPPPNALSSSMIVPFSANAHKMVLERPPEKKAVVKVSLTLRARGFRLNESICLPLSSA
ncbi:hypothetical protein FRB95_013782 [Tulasnella sp. JGI-2019a]|nr:hypothetical protein FRB95_013782 [Tulasnella sp. JGI-2019a]